MKERRAATPINDGMDGEVLAFNLIENLVDTNKNATEFTLDARYFYALPSLWRMLQLFDFIEDFFLELPRVFFRLVFCQVLASPLAGR